MRINRGGLMSGGLMSGGRMSGGRMSGGRLSGGLKSYDRVEQRLHSTWATPVHRPAWVYCVSAPTLSAHCYFWPAALNHQTPAPAPAHQRYIACNRPTRHASAPTRHNKPPECDGRNPQPQHRRAVYTMQTTIA